MIKIGVVGAGWWGKNIIRTLNGLEDVEEIWVYDSNKNAVKDVEESSKIKFVNALEKLENSDEISGVCVATPPTTHYNLTHRLLSSHKHVLVEKPPAFTANEFEELTAIAERSHLIYMLDALYLFLEPIQKLKEIICTEEIGKIRFVQMHRMGDELRREHSGINRIENVMYSNGIDVIDDLFFHDAGILMYLFDKIFLRNTKKLFLYNESICDSAFIEMQSNNFPIHLTLSWSLTGRKRGITIYTSNSIIEYDGLADCNQITKYEIFSKRREDFNFLNDAPLTKQLRFFINAIYGREANFLGSSFMRKLFYLWRDIQNGV